MPAIDLLDYFLTYMYVHLKMHLKLLLGAVGTTKMLRMTSVNFKTRKVISTKQTLIKKKIPYP